MNKTIRPGQVGGCIRVPSSKSVVHRQLICAAFGDRPTDIAFEGISRDIQATADCLRALGADIRLETHQIRVNPIPQLPREQARSRENLQKEEVLLPCGESGSTLRFLLPLVGALGINAVFHMEGRLPERPMEAYESLLEKQGMAFCRESKLLHVSGKLRPGTFKLPGDISSQYFSGLLLSLPMLEEESLLLAESEPESGPYIALTEDCLRESGIRMEKIDGKSWRIPGRQHYEPPSCWHAEGDWSNAAFFLCMGALSEIGGEGVSVKGLRTDSLQGDREICEILRRFGAIVEETEDCVTVRPGKKLPLRIDASEIPDLVPVLSILACGAEGESSMEHAGRLRMKESDRLCAVSRLIRDLGGEVTELPDGLRIRGRGVLQGGTIDSFRDHRIAMSAAVAAVICREAVTVTDAECVEKSWPRFWEERESL